MLLIFDDNNKKSYPIGTKLFIRIRIINISLVFFMPTHYLIMAISSKQRLQQFAIKYSTDIDFKNVMNPYKRFTWKGYSFIVNNSALSSDNPIRFRHNLLERI